MMAVWWDTPLYFVLMAILGSIVNVLMHCRDFKELKSYYTFSTIVIGSIAGFLYWNMYEFHHVPDSVAAFFVGYTVHDFFKAFRRRMHNRIW